MQKLDSFIEGVDMDPSDVFSHQLGELQQQPGQRSNAAFVQTFRQQNNSKRFKKDANNKNTLDSSIPKDHFEIETGPSIQPINIDQIFLSNNLARDDEPDQRQAERQLPKNITKRKNMRLKFEPNPNQTWVSNILCDRPPIHFQEEECPGEPIYQMFYEITTATYFNSLQLQFKQPQITVQWIGNQASNQLLLNIWHQTGIKWVGKLLPKQTKISFTVSNDPRKRGRECFLKEQQIRQQYRKISKITNILEITRCDREVRPHLTTIYLRWETEFEAREFQRKINQVRDQIETSNAIFKTKRKQILKKHYQIRKQRLLAKGNPKQLIEGLNLSSKRQKRLEKLQVKKPSHNDSPLTPKTLQKQEQQYDQIIKHINESKDLLKLHKQQIIIDKDLETPTKEKILIQPKLNSLKKLKEKQKKEKQRNHKRYEIDSQEQNSNSMEPKEQKKKQQFDQSQKKKIYKVHLNVEPSENRNSHSSSSSHYQDQKQEIQKELEQIFYFLPQMRQKKQKRNIKITSMRQEQLKQSQIQEARQKQQQKFRRQKKERQMEEYLRVDKKNNPVIVYDQEQQNKEIEYNNEENKTSREVNKEQVMSNLPINTDKRTNESEIKQYKGLKQSIKKSNDGEKMISSQQFDEKEQVMESNSRKVSRQDTINVRSKPNPDSHNSPNNGQGPKKISKSIIQNARTAQKQSSQSNKKDFLNLFQRQNYKSRFPPFETIHEQEWEESQRKKQQNEFKQEPSERSENEDEQRK